MIWLGRAKVPFSIPLTTLRNGTFAGTRSARAESVPLKNELGIAATISPAASMASTSAASHQNLIGKPNSRQMRLVHAVACQAAGVRRVSRPETNLHSRLVEEQGKRRAHAPGAQDRNPLDRWNVNRFDLA